MAVRTVVLRSQRVSIEEETVEGTPVAETVNGAILVTSAGAEFDLGRESIPGGGMSGSFSKDAAESGMYSDSLGVTIPVNLRGIGTLTTNGPDWQMLTKSAFGSELRATSGTLDVASTATIVKVKTGGAGILKGMLLYFPTQGEIRRVNVFATPNITLDTPLSAVPSEDDPFICGVNWLLTSSPGHPFFTTYGYFGEARDMRVRLTSCKTSAMSLTATVGGHCEMSFTALALEPLQDNTAQAVTPVYDTETPELVCLDMTGWQKVSAVITGTPTIIETVLSAPNFDVRVGDKLIVDVGASVWVTVTISGVSGNAGGNLTLAHPTLGAAGTATETCYVLRTGCADVGESLTITMDTPVEPKRCMYATYGKKALVSVDRNITIESEPYFDSWEQFLMRDAAVGMSMLAVFGNIDDDDQNNIVAVYISKKVNTTVGINNNAIMTQTVSSMAAKDAVLGDEYEMVMAAF